MNRAMAGVARLDWSLIVLVLLLGAVGVLNLQSTSMSSGSNIHMKQFYWLIVGAFAMIATAVVDYRHLDRLSPFLYGGAVVLLALVLGIGKEINGSRRWFDFGPVSVQPSELSKLAVIAMLASWFNRVPRPAGYTLRDLMPVAGILAMPMFLILQEPDLGHTLMLMFIGFSMLAYEKFDRRSSVTLLTAAVIATPLMWRFVLRDYQKDRILTLLDGEVDRLGAGWHALQARVAVGSGGIFGKGHGLGTQVAGGFLPENHTDFVFANLAEEHGLIGAGSVLLVYLLLVVGALRVASHARDKFGGHVAVGVAALIFWQVFMNIGMVLNLLPVTGVTLPLMSYGGSSVLTVMVAIGLLVNINVRRTVF
ncbi:MAG: rod shape-determining protein RodA [Myxococcales bacterium]|nr:rod shape-determining protein RodA [Myxococcales bacterium]